MDRREDDIMGIRRIACCVDFSRNAEAAFTVALEMAEKYSAKLFVVHVLPPLINPLLTEAEWVVPTEPDKSLILDIEERMQQEYASRIGEGIQSELIVRDGHVSTEILQFLEEQDVDLVIMGSYGLSGAGLVFFGSVAKRVAHKAQCSVMIVRSHEKKE
jgi:universal stress protein A